MGRCSGLTADVFSRRVPRSVNCGKLRQPAYIHTRLVGGRITYQRLGSEGKLPTFLCACEYRFLGAGMQFSTRNNFSTTLFTDLLNSANRSQKDTLQFMRFSDFNIEREARLRGSRNLVAERSCGFRVLSY
jgi:hypothetical protein